MLQAIFYGSELLRVLDLTHLLYVYLIKQLLSCLLNGMVIYFHLFGEELLQPCVFLDVVMDEAYRLFTLYFHGVTTFL